MTAAAPAPADDAVTVAVEAAAIGDPSLAARAEIPGLAAVGRVVATGDGGRHLEGARVVVGACQPCGECDVCRRGGATVCPVGRTFGVDAPGTAQATIVARARWVLPLGGALDVAGPAAALLGHEAALAYAMYARAGVGPREPTAIVGGGPIATLLAAVLAAKSAPALVTRGDGDLAGELAAAAAERGHGARPWKLFATDADAARRALAVAGPRATITIAAPGGLPAPIDVAAALAREATLLGVRGAHPDLLPEVAALAVRGDLDLAAVAEIISRDRLAAALAAPSDRALVLAL